MVKEDIVRKIANETGHTQRLVGGIVDALITEIIDEMSAGNSVQFMGFGTFKPKVMAAKTGRNPRTNQPIQIPERVVPSFKPGNRLKNAVSQLEYERED